MTNIWEAERARRRMRFLTAILCGVWLVIIGAAASGETFFDPRYAYNSSLHELPGGVPQTPSFSPAIAECADRCHRSDCQVKPVLATAPASNTCD